SRETAMGVRAAVDNSLFDGILTWATQPRGFHRNWPTGLALFLSGAAGALMLVYSSESGRLPRVGGTTRIAEAELALVDLRSLLAQAQSDWRDLITRDAQCPSPSALERWCTFTDAQIRSDETSLDRQRRIARRKTP